MFFNSIRELQTQCLKVTSVMLIFLPTFPDSTINSSNTSKVFQIGYASRIDTFDHKMQAISLIDVRNFY